ncbi:hypothetical protein LR48_Vigan10g060600 [Vigna angularis]|uniref:Uncharacterized protein n=1 Tax=Phaseolus angularis TaxID=3914 RepID=A0A0L9VJ04_PHAAN|nr:hypothetical protein LR48_Vigan10g060600 [Vigna angularis]
MTSSLGKMVKTIGHKRKEKEHIDSNKFLTTAHEKYFPTVEEFYTIAKAIGGEKKTYMRYVRAYISRGLCSPGGAGAVEASATEEDTEDEDENEDEAKDEEDSDDYD